MSRLAILCACLCPLFLFITACQQAVPQTGAQPTLLDPSPAPKPLVPPPADGFDFPVGPPNAKGYYNAQKFTRNNHLGDDWNGNGGGNTDLGDPVYAIGIGIVSLAEDLGGGWGNVVRVLHNIGTTQTPEIIESLYAHLDSIYVKQGDTLSRSQQLGTIGDAHGNYFAHLHLELRLEPGLPIGGGYAEDTTGYTDPTRFIKAHRPKH